MLSFLAGSTNRKTGALTLTQRIPLQRKPSMALTGLPNTTIDSSANTPYNDEVPVDLLAERSSRSILSAGTSKAWSPTRKTALFGRAMSNVPRSTTSIRKAC